MIALGAAGGVAVAYYLAARLGLALLSAPSDVAVFWPASGLAAGILILANRRHSPAIVVGVILGAVAASLMSDRNFSTSLLKGFCYAGEAVLVAGLIERWFGRPFAFDDLARVLGFVAAACLGAAASALGGAATMTLFHTAAPYWDVWHAWFLSDGVGIVMVAPLVIGLGQVWRKPPSRAQSIEAIGVLSLLALISWITVAHPTGSWLSFDPDAIVLPLLLWLIARCEPVFGIAGAFIISLTVIYTTTFGIGHFGDAAVPLAERVSGAQMVIAMVTLYTLVLAALFTQRKDAEQGLRESERRLTRESTALARLHEISSRLWLKRDLRQALDEILAGAIELLGADMGSIRIWDSARGMLRIEAHRGFKRECLDLFRQIPTVSKACERALRSGERMVVEDVEADRCFTPYRPLARAAGYRAIQSTPILSREGAPLGMLATQFRSVHKPAEQDLHLLDLYVRQAADIIEYHKADNALRESEERFAGILAIAGDAIVSIDGNQRITLFNDAAERLFGYSREEILNQSIDLLIPARFRAAHQQHIEGFTSGSDIPRRMAEQQEVAGRRKNGEEFPAEASISKVKIGGEWIYTVVLRDITERKRAEERQRTLVAELDHRVKNALATVSSVVSQTGVGSRSVASFVASLDGRIRSMATTQELLSSGRWHGISLTKLIRGELAPYTTRNNTEIDGPEVILKPEAGQAMAMVLHELATNAAKYGALSTNEGRVSIRWDRWLNGHPPRLALEWQEIDGPPVVAPGKSSFGTSTIRRLIPYEFGGTVDLAFTPAGVQCRLELPGDWLISDGEDEHSEKNGAFAHSSPQSK
jgi:PAS domain S-box-containing protein